MVIKKMKNAKKLLILIQKYMKHACYKTSIVQLHLENNAKCIKIPALVINGVGQDL